MNKFFEKTKQEENEIEFKGTIAAFNTLINKTDELLDTVLKQSGLSPEVFNTTNPLITYDFENAVDCNITVSMASILFPKYNKVDGTLQISLYVYNFLKNTLDEIVKQVYDMDNAFNILVSVNLSNYGGKPQMNINYDNDLEKEKDLSFFPYRLIDNSEVYNN